MEGGRVYGGSDLIALLDNSSNSLWGSSTSPSYHETIVNFDQEIQPGRRPRRKTDRHRANDGEDSGGEELDISPFHHREKKRRLTPEQVEFLERNFEVENKLEPERKVELAKELGLQPRQVAIWFQNRRARYKTKQLEKDYESLKASYDRLKLDYDTLIRERRDLQNEAKLLTKKLGQRDMEQGNLDPDTLHNQPHTEPPLQEGTLKIETEMVPKIEVVESPPPSNKQIIEDASSAAKSDMFDSESPHCTEGIQNSSTFLEDPPDSSGQMLDPDLQSEFSQEGDTGMMNMMSRSLLPPTSTPLYNNLVLKVEETCYDPYNSTSCSFSLVDDQPFCSWLY